MFNHTSQLNRRRFLSGTAAVMGATMLAGMTKRDMYAAQVVTPAGPLVIDDFTTGRYEIGPRVDGTYKHVVTGGMLGGHRFTRLQITQNDRAQPISLDVGVARAAGSFFNLSAGVGAYYGITIAYGIEGTGDDPRSAPLHENLAECEAIRLRFAPICILGSLRVSIYSAGAHVNYFVPHLDLNTRELTYDCPRDAFVPDTGIINWADVHQIRLNFAVEGQFALESVEAV